MEYRRKACRRNQYEERKMKTRKIENNKFYIYIYIYICVCVCARIDNNS